MERVPELTDSAGQTLTSPGLYIFKKKNDCCSTNIPSCPAHLDSSPILAILIYSFGMHLCVIVSHCALRKQWIREGESSVFHLPRRFYAYGISTSKNITTGAVILFVSPPVPDGAIFFYFQAFFLPLPYHSSIPGASLSPPLHFLYRQKNMCLCPTPYYGTPNWLNSLQTCTTLLVKTKTMNVLYAVHII